jgi:hypothetical protein
VKLELSPTLFLSFVHQGAGRRFPMQSSQLDSLSHAKAEQ